MRWLGMLVGFVLLAASCGGSDPPATEGPTSTLGPTTAAPSPTVVTTTMPPATTGTTQSPEAASQTPEDAARDGVVAAVAALPFSMRVEIVDSVITDEGLWAISRLTPAAGELADGCRLGAPDGKYPIDFICTTEYGEVLLLDRKQTRIMRAYPLPGVPAEIITFSNDAIYCGRPGKLPMPDAMLCRIDRQTLDESVVVYPPSLDSLIVQPCFFPPDTWSVSDAQLDVAAIVADGEQLFTSDQSGTWTKLDPANLNVIASDVAPPPGYDS